MYQILFFMKRTIISTAFIFLTVALSAQLSNFNGTWKINKEKSNVPADQLYLSQISIMIKGDSLITTRTYTDPNYQEYPFAENLTLDGKEAKISIYDMPRVSKATKNGESIVINSKTTFYGNGGEDNLTAAETWKAKGDSLSIDQVIQVSGQEFKGVFVYDKVK